MMKCDMWHQKCGCRRMFGGFLWFFGFVSLVLAWVAMKMGDIMEYDAIFWMMNALTLGVLSIPLKSRKRGCETRTVGCGGGDTKMCCGNDAEMCNERSEEEKSF